MKIRELEKGIGQKEKMMRTTAYGGKKGIRLAFQSDKAPSERNGQRGVKSDHAGSGRLGTFVLLKRNRNVFV